MTAPASGHLKGGPNGCNLRTCVFEARACGGFILGLLEAASSQVQPVVCAGEPSTRFLDETCARYRQAGVHAVVAIGGGSVVEPFLSPTATPLTDAIAWSGLQAFQASFLAACSSGAPDPKVREGMAYAALMSGIALANAGLGIVHGLASPLG